MTATTPTNGHATENRIAAIVADDTPIRLNLGAGDVPVPGFIPIDRKTGGEVFPLAYPDESVDEIRASHILEHFSFRKTLAVLKEWARVLKPGGKLWCAVPDFQIIAAGYSKGVRDNWGGYAMGGQIDDDDYHRSIFDEEMLTDYLSQAGFRNIHRWKSDVVDCASLPVSLNLVGTKGPLKLPKIGAIMSMPRLAFTDTMHCALATCFELGIKFRKTTGVFWGQCLERGLESYLEEDVEFVAVIDYDSVFRPEHFRRMAWTIAARPDIDALCPIQVKRGETAMLMGMLQDDGTPFPADTPITVGHFQNEVVRAAWGNFGLTFLRVSALRDLPHPWFLGQPNADNKWGEGRVDDDIYFWRHFQKCGKKLYAACRIPIGHAELLVKWPSEQGDAMYQYPSTYDESGMPEGVWR